MKLAFVELKIHHLVTILILKPDPQRQISSNNSGISCYYVKIHYVSQK